MGPSLRKRLTLTLVLANVLVMGTLAAWAAGEDLRQSVRRQRQFTSLLPLVGERLAGRVARSDWQGSLAELLSWPVWAEFSDAVLVDLRVVPAGGRLVPVGAFLNPTGSRRRPADFPMAEITAALYRATGGLGPVPVAGGLAIPLFTHEGKLWGGVYAVPRDPPPSALPFAWRALVAAGLATVVGAGAIYLLLGRGVVEPVEKLARAAEDFGQGRIPRLPPRGRSREMDALIAALEEMMERIRGFQAELESEVAAATRRAAGAERRAAPQERLAALGTLSAGLAHEINSPLAGALQGLETLRREARSERARRHGELTRDALERIAGLVQRLLRLAPARVEAGRCHLREVLADLPVFLESRLRRHRLVLDLPDEEGLEVAAAAGDLFPVLLNVVQNALDALDELPERSGEVRIQARREGERIVIEILDDGPGIPAELLPRLFEPFVTGKEPGRGTGLGLALAHATVRQLGGSIEAGNREGGGARVRLELPVAGPEGGGKGT